MTGFLQAAGDGDAPKLCSLVTTEYLERNDSSAESCEADFQASFSSRGELESDRFRNTAELASVTLTTESDSQAIVRVTTAPPDGAARAEDVVLIKQDGEWRINSAADL